MPLPARRASLRRSAASLLIVALAACGHSAVTPGGDAGAGPLPSIDGGADAGLDARAPGDAGGPTRDSSPPTFDAAIPPGRVRVMTANTTSGTQQSYEDPGIRIFQGLAPDVVLVQEFKYASGDLRALVDVAFGTSFSFYVEARTGGIPNAIVSRYPILESGTWADASVSDRAFAYARIDVPGEVDLWAVSLHLLTTSATARGTEATQLVGYIQAAVPAGDYLVIGGDLNTETADEATFTTFAPRVVVGAPFPVDQIGNPDTSTNRNRPHDWVLASPNLDSRKVPVVLGTSVYPDGVVFDTRVYTPISDVPPILAGDSAAAGMQHMPVVRDFVLDVL